MRFSLRGGGGGKILKVSRGGIRPVGREAGRQGGQNRRGGGPGRRLWGFYRPGRFADWLIRRFGDGSQDPPRFPVELFRRRH